MASILPWKGPQQPIAAVHRPSAGPTPRPSGNAGRAAAGSGRRAGGHAGAMSVRQVGVEEELLLVEPGTGLPRAVAGTVLRAARPEATGAGGDAGTRGASGDAAGALDFELQQQQLETNTEPCRALDDLGREVRRCRAAAAEAAGRAGVEVAALATSPVPVEPEVVAKGRYQKMAELFGPTAGEQLTCGCHVHVEIASEDEGIAALDRARPPCGPAGPAWPMASSTRPPACRNPPLPWRSCCWPTSGTRWPMPGTPLPSPNC